MDDRIERICSKCLSTETLLHGHCERNDTGILMGLCDDREKVEKRILKKTKKEDATKRKKCKYYQTNNKCGL